MRVNIQNYTTEESRSKAVEAARNVRRQRVQMYEELKNGNVTAEHILFNLDDYEFMKRVRVRRFLTVFKGISNSKADEIMEKLGYSKTKRLQGLGHIQKTNLLLAIERNRW